MNPRDCVYDDQASLSVDTGLGTPLLSRFDLIFKLVDTADGARDSNVTTYLLNQAIKVRLKSKIVLNVLRIAQNQSNLLRPGARQRSVHYNTK